jgi:hypothetical protein
MSKAAQFYFMVSLTKGGFMTYIVWVGGVPDYEGGSLREAQAVRKEWIDLGYDDVILEVIEK